MSTIATTLRARKPYRCENEHPPEDAFLYGHPNIEVGQTYVRLALTPNDNDINNIGWWTIRYCQTCWDQR